QLNGDTLNPIDEMAHPADIGNLAEGYPGYSETDAIKASPQGATVNGSGTVTLTAAVNNAFQNFNTGDTVTVANVGDSVYNGTFVLTNVGGNQIKYTDAAAIGHAASGGGTVSFTQSFHDPGANQMADFANWKGGCGREPESATDSPDTTPPFN